MVNILAVSDVELLNEDKTDLGFSLDEDVDVLINCGDLNPSYVQYLQFKYKPLVSLMVLGNHDRNFFDQNYNHKSSGFSDVYQGFNILNKDFLDISSDNSSLDLESTITFAGFSGIENYGDSPFFFKKKEVKNFNKYLKIKKLFKQFESLDIMFTHNPPKIQNLIPKVGSYHKASKELGELYNDFLPSIWFYGHIHRNYTNKDLDFLIENEGNKTYLINTVPYKFLKYNEETKEIKTDFKIKKIVL